MTLLHQRTAVITGGAQGIGYAIAERLVAEGARVVLGDVDGAAAQAAATWLGGPRWLPGHAATSPPAPMSRRWCPTPWTTSAGST